MRTMLVLAALLLAGCGSDTDDTPTTTTTAATTTTAPPAPVDVTVSTTGTYPVNAGFTIDTQSIPSGATVNLTFRNTESNPLMQHDWVLEGVEGAATSPISGGEEVTITFTAPEPGEYTYFCSVGDHRQQGMEGTLTVV